MKIRLTPELQHQIVASIRAGGYAHVAAQAWGVSEELWQRWLAAGRRPGAQEPYRSFVHEVEKAQAQARLKAEVEALAKDPRFWLKNGPGKDPAAAPGWAPPAKAAATGSALDMMSRAEFYECLATVRAALAAFPPALDAVARLHNMPGMDAEEPDVSS